MDERIAITAFAERTALAGPARSTWEAWVAHGESALAPLEGFDATGFGDPLGAQIWKTPEEAEDDPAMRILGPHGRLFDALARSVHEEAGLESYPRERVGLFAGVGMVDSPIGDLQPAAAASLREAGIDWQTFFEGAYRGIHPLWPLSMLGNVAVGQVSIDLDIRGDNLVTASDADAGLRALLEAAASVREDACDAAITGAVSGRIGPAALARLTLQGRPGLPLGEGGAAFVFERERVARARGATIHGFLSGGATTFGAAEGYAGPSGPAVTRAIESALARADRRPQDVGMTYLPARSEEGAGEAFAEGLLAAGIRGMTFSESLSRIGHLGAGAAAVDAALALGWLGAQDPTGNAWDGVTPPDVILVLTAGAEGGTGALVLETAR